MHNSIFLYTKNDKSYLTFISIKSHIFFSLGNAPWNVTAGFEQWDEVNIYIVF